MERKEDIKESYLVRVQHKKRLRKARVSDRKHSKSEQRSFPLKFPSAWINFAELGFLSY